MSGMQALDFDESKLTQEELDIKNQTPIFLYHGSSDKMIPIKNAKLSFGFLKQSLNKHLTTKIEKKHDHSISTEETGHLKTWFGSIMTRKQTRMDSATHFWIE